MQSDIYITGLGMISAIGMNVSEAEQSLRTGKSGLGPITLFNTVHSEQFPVCEVKADNLQLKQLLNIAPQQLITRTALLGIVAAREALLDAGIDVNDGLRTGLISSTSVGGMDLSEEFYAAYRRQQPTGSIRQVFSHDCGDSTERIADYLSIRDYLSTISTACSSAANAIMLGARLIRHGIVDRVIAGGTDSLTRFTLNGFNTLMILDRESCRPFDDTRSGLNLGEAAGFVVLESERAINASEKKYYAKLAGFGNANDAYHQTASSPEGDGPFLAMQKALQTSQLQAKDISYINVHGTGTPNNDLSEGKAMLRLFDHVPLFSSTKAYTGHTLGAAGGVEAVISCLSLYHQTIYPNLNFSTPIQDLNLMPVTQCMEQVPLTAVLSNSFGFGGNNSSLLFTK